jgi:hypothetical protein
MLLHFCIEPTHEFRGELREEITIEVGGSVGVMLSKLVFFVFNPVVLATRSEVAYIREGELVSWFIRYCTKSFCLALEVLLGYGSRGLLRF